MNEELRTMPQLVSDLFTDMANLVRKEGELIRREFSEKLDQTTRAGAFLGLGAALFLGGFLVLLQALVLALSKVMDPMLASIIVGVVMLIGGYVAFRLAMKLVQPSALTPDRSVRQAQKITKLAKGHPQ